MSIFSMDGFLMRLLTRIADLLILNFLTFVCCIPVITAGAALTALSDMCLKLVRNQEGYIVRGYFKAFKENFVQATQIWLLLLCGWLLVAVDIWFFYAYSGPELLPVRIAVAVLAVILIPTTLFAFPLQAKFSNPVKKTISNAFKAGFLKFGVTIAMALMILAEASLIIFSGYTACLVVLFGFSFHAYISAALYNGFFKKLEGIAPSSTEET